MTLVPSILGATYDAPGDPRRSLDDVDEKRALVLYRFKAAESADDAKLALLMRWELGLLDLVLAPAPEYSVFRGAAYENYAAHFQFTPDTLPHAQARAVETHDVLLKLRYLEFVNQRLIDPGEDRLHRLRDLAREYVAFVNGCMGSPVPHTGVYVDRALTRLGELYGEKRVLSPTDGAAHATWLLDVVRASRDILVDDTKDIEQQRPRWVAPFLRQLLVLPPAFVGQPIRDEARRLLHEALEFYRGIPLNHDFEIDVLETMTALREKWGERGVRAALIRDKADAILRRAEFHAGTGGALVAHTFFREASRLQHQHGEIFPAEERRRTQIAEQRSIEALASSGELHAISVPISFSREELDHSRDSSVATVAELMKLATTMGTRADTLVMVDQAICETPLLSVFSRSIISDGKVVGESGGVEKNRELDAESQMVLLLRLLGAAAMLTAHSGAERTGLSADDLLAPLRALPLEQSSFALIRHGLERAMANDWISATHILAIQCEPVLRQVLKAAGFSTTKLVPDVGDGTSRTHDLAIGGLLARKREDGVSAREFLGVDFSWRFHGALASQTGPNLRNAIAHGAVPLDGFGPEGVGMILLLLYQLASQWQLRRVDDTAFEAADSAE